MLEPNRRGQGRCFPDCAIRALFGKGVSDVESTCHGTNNDCISVVPYPYRTRSQNSCASLSEHSTPARRAYRQRASGELSLSLLRRLALGRPCPDWGRHVIET